MSQKNIETSRTMMLYHMLIVCSIHCYNWYLMYYRCLLYVYLDLNMCWGLFHFWLIFIMSCTFLMLYYSASYIIVKISLSQTSFSLYLHNQWTDSHKPRCTGKPQIRAICTYVGSTKVTANDWDIRPSVAIKALSANISWTAKQIHMIELALESAHQFFYNNIWCVSK